MDFCFVTNGKNLALKGRRQYQIVAVFGELKGLIVKNKIIIGRLLYHFFP